MAAFSRDGETRYYVQDTIVGHGTYIWGALYPTQDTEVSPEQADLAQSSDQPDNCQFAPIRPLLPRSAPQVSGR